MINLKTISVLLILPFSALSQSEGRQTKLSVESKQSITFDVYCLQNAISYIEVIGDKKSSLNITGELASLESNPSATYIDYGVELQENATQYFKLTGSDKVLAVKSLYQLRLSYSSLK